MLPNFHAIQLLSYILSEKEHWEHQLQVGPGDEIGEILPGV